MGKGWKLVNGKIHPSSYKTDVWVEFSMAYGEEEELYNNDRFRMDICKDKNGDIFSRDFLHEEHIQPETGKEGFTHTYVATRQWTSEELLNYLNQLLEMKIVQEELAKQGMSQYKRAYIKRGDDLKDGDEPIGFIYPPVPQ